MERISGVSAESGRVGQGTDDVEKLHHRARPSVGQDQRQGVCLGRGDVDRVNVGAADGGRDLVERVETSVKATEVVSVCPVRAQVTQVGLRNALFPAVDGLRVWPACVPQSSPEVLDIVGRGPHSEVLDYRSLNFAHIRLHFLSGASAVVQRHVV